VKSTGRRTDHASLGLAPGGHPLLGAAVAVAGSDEVLFTSRISTRTHPWLAGHRVGDTVVVPASVFVELAVRAGDEVGSTVVDELLTETPLVIPHDGSVQIQVAVGTPTASGQRRLTVHARPGEGDVPWTEHARGLLGVRADDTPADLGPWPPAGAEAVDPAEFHERAADTGAPHGPAFRSLDAAWRRGDEVFAEVSLESAQDGADYLLHPALLDAALPGPADDGRGVPSVSVWRGIRLYAAGSSALRVRLNLDDSDGAVPALRLSDSAGLPVAAVDSVVRRRIDASEVADMAARTTDQLFRVAWTPLRPGRRDTPARWGVVGAGLPGAQRFDGVAEVAAAVAAGTPLDAVLVPLGSSAADGMVEAAHEATNHVLELAQRWLAEERLADVPLVVMTRSAVSTHGGELPDPSTAAAWGLLRSAQSEAPGRILLLDIDIDADADADAESGTAPMDVVLSSGEPQAALRAGRLLVPRLRYVEAGERRPLGWNPDGTVLVTGGTGSLGALFARHLVREHNVSHLLLTSRRGTEAPGAAELTAELEALGARVTVVACDVADRAEVAALLSAIPERHPLTAVLHTAGVLDDGIVGSQTPERLAAVLGPKADAAWHLHDLTRGSDLAAFVLFSSIAGVVGGPGQSTYAAANAFLDALAQHRGVQGLAATSIAWGLWSQDGGMSGGLDEADLKRIARSGFRPVTADAGTALLDLALGLGEPALVATPLDHAAVREQGVVPALLSGVVRGPRRRTVQVAGPAGEPLADRLAGLDEAGRTRLLTQAVKESVAEVLGHAGTEGIGEEDSFLKLGFDSLTAVELRSRLHALTGFRLPATLVFDHPTPTALVSYLHRKLAPGEAGVTTAEPSSPDFAAEVRLAEDIRPAGVIVPVTDDPRHVLLTGASGFLGSFLLRDLMRSTRATVHCLVRGSDKADAHARLRANMERYGTWEAVDTDRLSVIVGDLAEPRLGLTEEDFDHLAATVDVVYHNGARVHWLHPYTSLKAANVGGTEEILRLAARHRTVPVHYMSTVGVFQDAVTPGVPLKVTDPTGPAENLPSGYLQSKWVAEQIIGIARERGLPVSVYRVDVISGDQVNGACQTNDFVWLSIKGLLQARSVPADVGGRFHLLPVDYVSAAVLRVAGRASALGGTFHLFNRSALSLQECARQLRSLGYSLAEVDRDTWRARVQEDRGNAMVPLLHAFEMMTENTDAFYPPMDTAETEAALEGSGIECPPLTEDLFARYVNYFVRTGHFPAAS
ncbi:thioester reductase domain-containing protein, partial [Streptomyces sp. NPDC048142]|uniref:thioester reductase domain-containing protein n=1 Tax=Streptomyces sp. NPDC048142 TaxID=3365501 RepID=UPI0037232EFE